MSIGTPTSLGSNKSEGSPVSNGSMTTTAAIVAGNLVVVVVSLNSNNGITVSSISDGTNSYTKAISFIQSSVSDVEIWYKANASAVGSSATITANFSGSSTGSFCGFAIAAAQITGIATTSPLDQHASNGGTTLSTITATTPSLSQANEIAIGACLDANSNLTYSGASGFTNLFNISNTSGPDGNTTVDYDIVSSTSAISYSPTWNTTNNRIAAVVATFEGAVTDVLMAQAWL